MPICPYKSNARTKIWMIRISSRVLRKWWDVDENWLESYRAWTAGESLILHIAFFGKKNISKTSYCDTIKLKNTCEFNGHPNTTHSHTQGLHPFGSTSATTLSVVALRHYEGNTGQIALNKYQTWQRVDGGSECIYDYPDDSDRCHHLISWDNAAGGARYSGSPSIS